MIIESMPVHRTEAYIGITKCTKKSPAATELLLKKIHDNESDSNLGEIMDVEIVDRQSVISLY